MDFTLTHVRLLVDDFRATFHFYRDLMSFDYRAGDESGPYVEFFAGNVVLSLFLRTQMLQVLSADYTPRLTHSDAVLLCFNVADVDAMVARLRTHGVSILLEPQDMPEWSLRVAHFRDPEGNLIEVNQPL